MKEAKQEREREGERKERKEDQRTDQNDVRKSSGGKLMTSVSAVAQEAVVSDKSSALPQKSKRRGRI